MREILYIILFTFLLSGCNQALTITEVKMDKVSGELKEVIDEFENENGNYVFSDGKEQYVFLNRINVMQGEDAVALSNFKTEVKENVLSISFEEEATTDYENQDLTYQMLYKIKGGKDDYDTIDLIGNDESTHFDSSISY